MSSKSRYGGPGGWIRKGKSDSLTLRVRDFLARHPARAQTSFVAQALGVDRGVAYTALTQLHAARVVSRRPDARGRVWWFPREDVGLVRKERIVFALERARDGLLPTSQLGRAWGETDSRRAYVVLNYYRSLGLLETLSDHPGTEALWRIRQCAG